MRTQKIDSAGTFNYVTDGTSPAAPVLKDGAANYTPGLSEHRGSTSKFYHTDALGSTRGVTDTSQAATDSVLYDAFGMTVSRTGTTPTPFGFVGKAQYQTDSDSGLQLLGHRYYDSSIGRFISSDPIQAGTNYYAYCNNNPLTEIDPEGTDGGALALGIGLAVFSPEPVSKSIGIGIIVVVAAGAVLAAGYIYYKAHQDDGFPKDGGGNAGKEKIGRGSNKQEEKEIREELRQRLGEKPTQDQMNKAHEELAKVKQRGLKTNKNPEGEDREDALDRAARSKPGGRGGAPRGSGRRSIIANPRRVGHREPALN